MVFTEEAPVDSYVEDSNLSQTVQAQFNGMSLRITPSLFCLMLPSQRLLVQWNTSHAHTLISRLSAIEFCRVNVGRCLSVTLGLFCFHS